MPHKHRRNDFRARLSPSYDLPATTQARPLQVHKVPNPPPSSTQQPPHRRKQPMKTTEPGYGEDDTPRAFARLMRFQSKPPRSGLDDGAPHSSSNRGKKRKRTHKLGDEEPGRAQRADSSAPSPAPDPPSIPRIQIQPGERLSSFSARVDAALPIAGLKSKGNRTFDRSLGLKGERVTKLERKMHRMQRDWRADEKRLKEKREEEADEMEEDDDDWGERVEMSKVLEGGKRRKRGCSGGGDEGDPWAVLKKVRGDEGRQKNLMDVVQAPPKLVTVKEKFKVRVKGATVEVGDVPAKVGSLRRREELGRARQDVVEQYRNLKVGRRNG